MWPFLGTRGAARIHQLQLLNEKKKEKIEMRQQLGGSATLSAAHLQNESIVLMIKCNIWKGI